MKLKIALPILFLSFIFLEGCSGLSRGKAKDDILSNIKERNISILIPYTNDYCRELACGVYVPGSFGFTPEGQQYLNKLISLGYLEKESRNGIVNFAYGKYDIVVPTQKITPFSSYKIYRGLYVNVAELGDIDITGITGSDNSKNVEYNEIFNLTTLGKEIGYTGNLVYKNHSYFTKYDDGWRSN